jgi:hypothetical protein
MRSEAHLLQLALFQNEAKKYNGISWIFAAFRKRQISAIIVLLLAKVAKHEEETVL